MNLSLRLKITISFVLLVVAGGAVSTTLGSRIITRALLAQANRRVSHGLDAVQIVYASRLDRVKRIVSRAATDERLVAAAGQGDAAALRRLLLEQRQKEGALDLLSYADPGQGLSAHGTPDGGSAPRPGSTGMVVFRAAAAGRPAAGSEVLGPDDLREESAGLVRRAATGFPNGAAGSGLLMVAAAPVRSGERSLGVVYGGVLLNGDTDLVDHVRDLIFGADQSQGESGIVSIFLGDVRIATNLKSSSKRALGGRAAKQVSEAALGRGERWRGRAEILDSWFITAYRPIADFNGRNIGMLGVGLDEEPFLAVRTEMMLSFLIVAAIGVLVVLGVTYLITRSMILPLEEMVAGTKRIAGGDLDYRVQVHARDEIGLLASSFNAMLDALREMKGELQEWAHTLEQKVKERTDELVAMQSSMVQSEKLASLGRLAAGVAHEINNPLGGILSFSLLTLEDCPPDHPHRERLELISKQALRCREIVRGLLEFARHSDVPESYSQINTVVNSTLSLLSNQAIFHNIKITRRLAEGLPPILIDPGHLQQVIMNLVLNAVDAMEQTGELTVTTAADAAGGEVLLAISDNGKGIPKDLLPLIFEPFFTTKKVGQGTGLGLSIVHGIVSRVKGRIEVSTSPSGTTFTLHFPVSQSAG